MTETHQGTSTGSLEPASATALWGKAPERMAHGERAYPLLAHLLDTFSAMGHLWDHWLSPRLKRLIAAELTHGDLDAAKRWAQATAGLHDLGKATPVFQMQAASKRNGLDSWRSVMRVELETLGLPEVGTSTRNYLCSEEGRLGRRHEFLGMAHLASGELTQNLGLGGDWLGAIVGGHHGKWHNLEASSLTPTALAGAVSGPEWSGEQDAVVNVVAAVSGLDLRQPPLVSDAMAGVIPVLLTGLTTLADWIASSDDVVRAGLNLIAAGARPVDSGWLEARDEELRTAVAANIGGYVPPPDGAGSLFGNDASWSPRPLQVEAAKGHDGAWFVAYPTGEGKTDAALIRHVAGEPEGLIFGLPTRATTNEMHTRLARRFNGTENTVILSHQYASTVGVECASEYGLSWYTSSIRRLVAPVLAATCDQILVGSLRQKHAALRLLALANHHIVLDEVHTYDQYQSYLLKELLAWWGKTGTRVTLLSATMPAWQQRDFARAYARQEALPSSQPGYPAAWTVHPSGTSGPSEHPALSRDIASVRFCMQQTESPTEEHVSWALRTHQDNPRIRIAIIRSTVDSAIATAREVKEALGESAEVRCLHSRMTNRHRNEVQEAIAKRVGPGADPQGPPLVVVATQVLEAALDYDFDALSCDLAPATALLQRAGRLWRFDDAEARAARFDRWPDERAVHVVVGAEGGEITPSAALPYFSDELRRVQARLSESSTVRIPDDVQEFVDTTTFDIEDAFAVDASDELGQQVRMLGAANSAASRLRDDLCGDAKRKTYRHIFGLTDERGDAGLEHEDRMRTRFIERESRSFILVDGPFGASATNGAELGGLATATALECVVSASGVVARALAEASKASLLRLELDEWRPANAALLSYWPVHVDDLEQQGLAYDSWLGLARLS